METFVSSRYRRNSLFLPTESIFFILNLFIYYLFYLFILAALGLSMACRIFIAACGLFSCGTWTLGCGMWDLVPWPGIEPGPPALGVQSLTHWTTREVPESIFESQYTPGDSRLLQRRLGKAQTYIQAFLASIINITSPWICCKPRVHIFFYSSIVDLQYCVNTCTHLVFSNTTFSRI